MKSQRYISCKIIIDGGNVAHSVLNASHARCTNKKASPIVQFKCSVGVVVYREVSHSTDSGVRAWHAFKFHELHNDGIHRVRCSIGYEHAKQH